MKNMNLILEKKYSNVPKKYWNNFAYFMYNFLDKIFLIVLSTESQKKKIFL